VGFEPTIPAFEREKTVHALDRAATVIGIEINIDVNSVLEILHHVIVGDVAGVPKAHAVSLFP
jgi:hypothetical protein